MSGPVDPPRPSADDVFAVVKEFTERLDRMGLAGAIVVRCEIENGAGRLEMRGQSERWPVAPPVRGREVLR